MTQEAAEPDYKAMRAKLIEDNKLRIEARFIPQSQSRNAKEKYPSLNWKIALFKGDKLILEEQDYSQGIGHVPHWIQNPPRIKSYEYNKYLSGVAETGKCYGTVKRDPRTNVFIKYTYLQWNPSSWQPHKVPLPSPSIEEYLYCLIADARVLDSGGFSGWCAELGYDDDSIKAKETYDYCVEIAVKLRGWIDLEKFQEAYSDY